MKRGLKLSHHEKRSRNDIWQWAARRTARCSSAALAGVRAMIRFTAMLAATLALTFVLALAASQAQQRDDDVRTFLLPPEGCEAPCWQGIRPGVTTLDEAVALLEANPWVERVIVDTDSPFTFIYLDWNDQAPIFARNVSPRLPLYMWVRRGFVQLIVVPTLIPYGDVWSLLGAPATGTFAVSGYRTSMTLGARPNTRHTAIYYDGRVVVDTRVYCPVNPTLFWEAPVTISYSSDLTEPLIADKRYDLVDWLFSPPCNS
jgi:hypothetical protein